MAGSGEKADRRPIDPPPIIRLRTRRPSARKKPAHLLTDDDLATPTLTHTLFMFASLVEEDSEEEMFEVHGSKSALVAGSVVSSLFHLRDQSCFVFPDMSVRMEGRWRFKMSLYEVSECVGPCASSAAQPSLDEPDPVCLRPAERASSSARRSSPTSSKSTRASASPAWAVRPRRTLPLPVGVSAHPACSFAESTELSKSFAQQGLKLRIRRPGTKCVVPDA